jgi:ribose transport system permease protein
MSAISLNPPRQSDFRIALAKNRGLIAIVVVFACLLAFVDLISPVSLGYYDINSILGSGAALALASIGQTFVILVGGFDLSAGAVISLVNAFVATTPQDTTTAQVGVVFAGLAIGAAVGAFNGFFVAFVGLQPIVVTLATMFLVRGVTLLILPDPGGAVAHQLTSFFTGSAIPGVLPAPALVILGAIGVWLALKRTRFGTALFATGCDSDSAYAAGINVRRTRFAAFVLGGTFYAAAGVFIAAQTGAADPLVGDPMLLQTFTAVVLGGTLLGGGSGGAVGSVFGAYTLMLMINILLVLDVSAYYATIVEGIVLILAVFVSFLGRDSIALRSVLHARDWLRARSRGMLAAQVVTGIDAGLPLRARGASEPRPADQASWLSRHAEFVRYTTPAYLSFMLVILATALVSRDNIMFSLKYYDSLLVLSTFLAILALGQGGVILAGGLDLSVPWTIAFCGILAAGLIQGSNVATIWVVPLVLAAGALIGMFNGLGVTVLGLPPIVITLATNGILQGAALLFSGGTPAGFASPSLRWLLTGSLAGLTPVVFLVLAFVVFAVVLLDRTVFGRSVYAVGNSPRASFLSAVGVNSTITRVYMLSGFCSALVGILATGFSGQASLGMGDDFLLPSIAVVVVGGTLITGGRGHYLGMIGGVLLLTALQTLLAGTTWPHAVRDIIFGGVVLVSVVALRDR